MTSPFLLRWFRYERRRGGARRHLLSNLVDLLLRAGVGGVLPAAQDVPPRSRLALGDEVDFAEDGAAQQDVDPGVEDLVPRGQPHARHHQGLVGGQVLSDGARVGADRRHQAEDLRGRKCNFTDKTVKDAHSPEGAPADTGGDHDADQLHHHLDVVGLGRVMGARLPPEPSQHQRQSADGVARQRHGQRGQTQSGEQRHQRQIRLLSVTEHLDETPGPRVLIGVGAQLEARQHGHAQSRQPDEGQAHLRAGFGDQRRVQQRLGDAQAALGRHGAAHEERTKAKEDHAAAQELTHGVRVLEVLGGSASGEVEPEHQGAGDHVAEEVRDHQGPGEQQERGLGAPALEGVGIGEDEEGHDVGDDAQRHGEYDHDAAAGGGLQEGEVPRLPAAGHPGLLPAAAVVGETRELRRGGGVVVAQR
ncbi:hypothetical protein EYF80_039875 [Liparis tanakae]|uniref:Uncharacterized protein n=1 Tax=Liparis tanakae TaxID=230148 RepID=A0A4Z2G8W3_9TELE|nr:hypothetical protein EYF80_039875 [Liparis tanakae]